MPAARDGDEDAHTNHDTNHDGSDVTMPGQVERTVTVSNRQGLHARPASEFVKVASRFESEIHVEKDELEVNGKSIMGVMMLAAEPGTTLAIRADGDDSREAVEALVELVEDGFGEYDGKEADGDDAAAAADAAVGGENGAGDDS